MRSMIPMYMLPLVFFCAEKAEARNIYVYEVEISDAEIGGVGSFEAPSQLTASVLKSTQPGKCIDLRSLGSASTNGHLDHGTIGILVNQSLDRSFDAKIQEAICGARQAPITEPATPGKKKCQVAVRAIEYNFDDAVIGLDPMSDREIQARGLKKGTGQSSGVVALSGKPMIPEFSKACNSGVYKDSWNDAASTPAARAYLKQLGVDISGVRTIDVRTVGGKEIFSFGFPTH